MIESLFKVLSAGLSIWENHEKTKYIDRLMQIKREYYAEYNKTSDVRDDAVLDNLEWELRVLSSAFYTSVGEPNSKTQH